jgi:hypothetical protein
VAHTVLHVGDLAQIDQSFAGWLPVKILETVRERDYGQNHYTVRAVVQLTIQEPRSGYRPGETLTVDVSDVLPRKGWRTGSSVFRTYHPRSFCHGWAGCEACGRTSSQVPAVRRDAR